MALLAEHPLGEAARTWLTALQQYAQADDYDGASALFADELVFFGGSVLIGVGPLAQAEQQWRYFWPQIRGLTFRLDEAQCFGGSTGLCVASLFDFQRLQPDGSGAPSTSRLTVMLVPRAERWLGVHAHWSSPRARPSK